MQTKLKPVPDTTALTPSAPIAIEKGVPLSGRPGRGGKNAKYPWREMQVGDSFLAPGTTIHKFNSVRLYGEKMTGFKFASRTVPGGVRVWRIALLLLALATPLHADDRTAAQAAAQQQASLEPTASDHGAVPTPAATPALSDTLNADLAAYRAQGDKLDTAIQRTEAQLSAMKAQRQQVAGAVAALERRVK